MSTHKDEIMLLINVARKNGAIVYIEYDKEEKIDYFKVYNLHGKDYLEGILSNVEALREEIGKEAMAPLKLSGDVLGYLYTPEQIKVYGGIERLANILVMNNNIENNVKFKVAELGAGKETYYYANINNDLFQFKDEAEFKAHNNLSMKIDFSHSTFDCNTESGRADYKKATQEMSYLGFTPHLIGGKEKDALSELAGEITIRVDMMSADSLYIDGTQTSVSPWSEARREGVIDVFQVDANNESIKSIGRKIGREFSY